MSIIIGKLAGAAVKALAGATVGSVVTKAADDCIVKTGALATATRTTKKVVSAATCVGGIVVGDAVVNTLIDTANANGQPLEGSRYKFATPAPMYTREGVLIGTPKHKQNQQEKIKVEIVNEGEGSN